MSSEGFFSSLFEVQSFMPHGHCYLWYPEILWLHVISDVVISLSYYSIPAAIIYLVIKRKDLPFNWIFWLFGAFIILCGTTHVVEIITVWNPIYGIAGLLKGATAIVSALTAYACWPLIPKALSIPSSQMMKEANQQLESFAENMEKRVSERTQELSQRNNELETLNEIHSTRESRIIELKKEVNELKKRLGEEVSYKF